MQSISANCPWQKCKEKIIKNYFIQIAINCFFSSVSLVWSIGILFRCVVSLKVKTYSFTLKQVLSNFMIFKGKDFIQYASNKQITFDKLSNSEKKEIKIMKAETLFRINLFYLPNPTPKSGTTFYREGWVYYYNLSTDLSLLFSLNILFKIATYLLIICFHRPIFFGF